MKRWKKSRKNLSQKKKQTPPSTTPKTYLWAGTESLFPTGFINCTDSESNINAKYVVTIATGDEEPSKCIFNSGDTLMEWNASKFPTLSISKTSQPSTMLWLSTKNWCASLKSHSSARTWKKSSKTTRATCWTKRPTLIWKSKVWFLDIDYLKVTSSYLLIYSWTKRVWNGYNNTKWGKITNGNSRNATKNLNKTSTTLSAIPMSTASSTYPLSSNKYLSNH